MEAVGKENSILSDIDRDFEEECVLLKSVESTPEFTKAKSDAKELINNFIAKNRAYARNLQKSFDKAFSGSVVETASLFMMCSSIAVDCGYPVSFYAVLIKRVERVFGWFKVVDNLVQSCGGYSYVHRAEYDKRFNILSKLIASNFKFVWAFINSILSGSIIYSQNIKPDVMTDDQVTNFVEDYKP